MILDNEVSHGHNARLYQVWNEKSNMMKIVADLNPFGSKYFLWLDIGAVRHSKYNHQPLVGSSRKKTWLKIVFAIFRLEIGQKTKVLYY